ncbi:MAG TPA: hypothetical protein VIH59_29330 [Candidatus Tectomicrobia bacterium]|jgi:hypothetical protein
MEERRSWDEIYPLMAEVKALAWGLLRHERQASLQTTTLVLSLVRVGNGRAVIVLIRYSVLSRVADFADFAFPGALHVVCIAIPRPLTHQA